MRTWRTLQTIHTDEEEDRNRQTDRQLMIRDGYMNRQTLNSTLRINSAGRSATAEDGGVNENEILQFKIEFD